VNKLSRLFLAAGLLGFVAIVILSLVPSAARPHSGAGGELEHVAAYFLVAAAFGVGFRNRRRILLTALLMVTTAGVLEWLQLFIPGRTAELVGFAASALGTTLGTGLALIRSRSTADG